MPTRLRHAPFATLFVGLFAAPAASAQCIPGTAVCYEQGKISVPSQQATVSSPTVSGSATTPTVSGQTTLPNAQVQAWNAQQNAWRLEWDLYMKWRARVALSAQADLRLRLHAEARARAEYSPDPFYGVPPPRTYGVPEASSVSFPRVGLGFLALCFGHLSGSGAPILAGYCPSITYRPYSTLTVIAEVGLLEAFEREERGHLQIGFHPAATYALLRGPRGETYGSSLYLRGGLDAYLPANDLAHQPAWFGGAHVGIGVQDSGRVGSVGCEVRAIGRFGIGEREPGAASELSNFRAGFMTKLYVTFEL